MKPWEYYNDVENKRPDKKDFTVVYIYQGGVLLDKVGFLSYNRESYPEKAVFERVCDELNYKNAMEAYKKRKTNKFREFQIDLLEEFDLINHPKAPLAMEMAWDKHQSYEETYYAFEELSKLLID